MRASESARVRQVLSRRQEASAGAGEPIKTSVVLTEQPNPKALAALANRKNIMRQDTQLHELPRFWQKQVADLRKDCARYRVRVRELEAQLAELTEGSGRDITTT
jgi:hypothetical protein